MPRIRTIKPEFWTSLTVTSLPLPVRLTFIGLWNFSDDAGRSVLEPRLIKAAIWPLDDEITAADVGGHIAALAAVGLVELYEVAGRKYLQVSSWGEHQKVEKPRTSQLPAPPASIPEASPMFPRSVPDAYPLEGKGRERNGEERNGRDGEASSPRRVTDTDLYREVRTALPVAYHDALDGHLRASQNPPALLAELKAIASGMHPPAYDWPIIGRSLQELAVAGGRLTPKGIRAFCRGIVNERENPPPPRDAGDEYEAAVKRLEAKRNAS